MFGPHLMLDLYGCNKKKLSGTKLISKMLDEIPDLINMTKISKPSITVYSGNSNSFDRGGISGFILIAESHITIHTFIKQHYVSVDVFSCKDFDVKKVEDYFIKKFNIKNIEKNFIMRGIEFPKDIEKSKAIVLRQRKTLKNYK